MEQQIISRLDMMNKNIELIKEYLEDIMLTKDDLDSIEEAERDLEAGRTVSLEDLKKELKL